MKPKIKTFPKTYYSSSFLGNAHNRLGLLSNTQFVECRVYDEDEEEEELGVEKETQVKAPPGVEKGDEFEDEASATASALQAGIAFIDRAFHEVEVNVKKLNSFIEAKKQSVNLFSSLMTAISKMATLSIWSRFSRAKISIFSETCLTLLGLHSLW